AIFSRIAGDTTADAAIRAKAQLHVGICYEKLGDAQARGAYERLIASYPDQTTEVAAARARLAALTAALEKPAAAAAPAGLTVRRVWTGNTSGSISPDGRYLTSVSERNLAVRDLATGETRQLTSLSVAAGEFVELSVFSPDGMEIAYSRMNADRTWDLCMIGLDGTGNRVLVHLDKMDRYENWVCPTGWSPDGRKILAGFARSEASGPVGEIAFVSVANGSVQIVRPTEKIAKSSLTDMRLSPDGRYIAYHAAAAEGPPNDIYLLSSNGGSDYALIRDSSNDFAPAWTPDGKRLLFVSDRRNGLGFWMIEISDGKPQGTPTPAKSDIAGFERSLGFTREGAYFYASTTAKEDLCIAGMNPDTGAIQGTPEVISAGAPGSNAGPAWSPDGRYLAWYRQRGPNAWAPGGSVIVIRSLETGNERELSTSLIAFGGICWFPDGRSLLVSAFRAERDWRIDYYRINVASGETSPLKDGGTTPWPSLSPDGKTIFYSGVGSLRAYEIETGKEREIYHRQVPGARVRTSLHVSPVGDHVAFVEYAGSSQGDSIVEIVPTAGGQARELLRVSRPGYIAGNRALAWTPDGSYLLVVKGNVGDPPATSDVTYELLRVPAAGGPPQTLRLAGLMHSLSVRPDGKRIAYTALSQAPTNEIWMVEGFPVPSPGK
ncbi:MAG: translocation protein TolB, partial [candidate division NC10 bacterium]|nr:translocation protein TolB [candidate division NC10 bacterium]